MVTFVLMAFLRYLFFICIQGSLQVAFSATSLAAITYIEQQLAPSPQVLLWVFFGTIAAYNFIKFATIAGWRHKSLPPYLRWIQLGSFLATALALWFSYQLSSQTWIWICLMGTLVVLYTLPILAGSNLRSLPGIKIFVVAAVWAGVTVIIPLVQDGQQLNLYAWNLVIRRLLMVLILILPFEIRDLHIDEPGLKTLPTWIGLRDTKRLALVLGGLLIALLFLDDSAKHHLLVEGLIGILAVYAVQRSEAEQPTYYASFWVEGIPLLWLGVLLGVSALTG